MIKNIYGNSAWINVQTMTGNQPHINTTQPIAGMIRYNASNGGCTEVYDGQSWQQIANGSASIDLSENSKQALTWAHKKMQEEIELLNLLERHPGLRDLHDKFEMMKVLCQEEEKKDGMV